MSLNLHTNGKLESFEKNRYFAAKLMTARDMLAEQDYHADRLEAIARYVTGDGIACGLDVAAVSQADDELEVKLTPGFALDPAGNPIVVTESGRVVVEDPETNQPALPSGENPIYLYLRYDECSIETVPKPGVENACKKECTYNRILEVFDVVFEEVDPDAEDGLPRGYKSIPEIDFPDPDEVTEENGDIPAEDPGLVKMARRYYAENSTECSTPTYPWVFLGTFDGPDADGNWGRVDPDVPDRSYVYTNDFLYAGIARHTADFHNPHQVTLTVNPLEEIDVPDGADAFLASGSTFEQEAEVFFDGRVVVESITGDAFEGTTAAERTFQLREIDDGDVGDLAMEFALDDDGHAVIDTSTLEGRYVVIHPEEDAVVRVSSRGVGTVAPDSAVESAAFGVAVEVPPEEEAGADGAGAAVRIRDDETTGGAVDIGSSNGSISITGTPRGAETPSEIDLAVSIEAIASQIDAVRSIEGVGGDDDGNVALQSETVDIIPDATSNSITLSVPEYDPIERLNGVGPTNEGNVDLVSESLDISPDAANNSVRLEAPGIPDDFGDQLDELENRVTRLERLHVKKSIHCKFTSYSVAREKFADVDAIVTPIDSLIDETQTVIGDENYSQQAYLNFIEQVRQFEEELNEALNPDVATRPSVNRYEMAFGELSDVDFALETVSDVIAAQDCLSKAAEWLQPAQD